MTTEQSQQYATIAATARQIWGESAKAAAQHILDSSCDAAGAAAVLDMLRDQLPDHAFGGVVNYAYGRRTISGEELQYSV